jgi:murein DD-endopeptidase MepM/ murein hydrolase activator NlpD
MWWNATDGAHVRSGAGRVALVLALVAAAAVTAVPGPPAQAAPLDDARTKVVEAQRAADAAGARYEEAVGRLEQLGIEIEDLRVRIEAGRVEAARLRVLARRRAVEAYIGRDGLEGAGAFVFEGGDPLDEVRRDKLLARTKERDDAQVDALVALERDLAAQRTELEARRSEQERAVEQVNEEQVAVQAQLRDAQTAVTLLEEQLRREEEAQKARELAAAVAREASNRNNGRDYSGAFVSTGIICPVRGAVSFVDSWHAPRHQGLHMGVDLMAARGTPDVALVSGDVEFLAQGEVIGYVGNTGDAQYTASHTHFEIHPNGGEAVNPYPSVAAVC